MVLSVSRRTDIPCCYPKWFMSRLRAGYALTRNPYNSRQVSRISLSPRLVDCVVFWTKDPEPLTAYLPEIDRMGYKYCFQFTLTGYGDDIEKGLRPKEDIIETFIRLSRRIGSRRLQWRYDPILLGDGWTVERHLEVFADLCRRLAGWTRGVTVSFVDDSRRCRSAGIRPLSSPEIDRLGRGIGRIAAEHRLPASTCCEAADLSAYGIYPGPCIGRELLEAACGCPLELKADRHQRPGCGCMSSVDIGAYNTCRNDCIYCYASDGPAAVERRTAAYAPDGELLCGRLDGTEKITERRAVSCRETQLRL